MKTALITGATSGIGYEFCRLFAKDKINLFLVSRNSEKLEEIKQNLETEFAISVGYYSADLSVQKNVEAFLQHIEQQNIKVDFLINNAGFGDFGEFIERDIKKFREMIALNINALTELTYFFAAKMKNNDGGKILNVASIASLCPVPFMAVYGATKAYVLSFSNAIYREFKKSNVRVTALLPGPTDTNFFNAADWINVKMINMAMSPQAVAKAGYKAMMKGRMQIIAGMQNKILGFFQKIIPTNLVLAIAEKMTKNK